MKHLQKRLSGHVVVCGYGLSGAVAVRELLECGFEPDSIVVIDPQTSALEAAAELGVTGLLGDPSREDLLQQVRVRDAKAVLICVPEDATAILLTLSVRSLAPDTRIVVRVKEPTWQRQLRQAGADVIVSATSIAGLLLADAVDSARVVPFVNDLLSKRGRAHLAERPAQPHEVGRWSNTLHGALVVGLARAGRQLSFYEDAPAVIERGDLLLVIESTRAEAESA